MKKFSFLFAALCMALTMSATEVTVTIGDYAAANGWENSVQYTSLTMDEVVTVTANPTTGTNNNTGKYYENGLNWRMYQNEAPAITVSAAEGYLLTSVTFTYESNKTGVMVDADGAQVASAEAYALDNVASVTFSVSNTDATVTNGQARITAIAVSYEAASAIEWIPMELEISNLTTEVLNVGDQAFLQLMGRNDMMDADVMLFLNNYTGEDKAYEVNAESSIVTFGGLELAVLDGSITKTTDEELGDVFAGTVHAFVEEDGEGLYVEFALTMYAAPATEIEIEDVTITIDEESAIATFAAEWEGTPLSVEVSGFEAVEFMEYEECWLSIGDDNVWVDAAVGPVAIIIEDGVAELEGEFTSYATGKSYYVMLSGTLPVKEDPVVPEQVYTENNLNTYASGLTSTLEGDVLTVNYVLNNSNATSVNVLVYNGEEVVATVAGTTTIGKNTIEVATATLPQGVQLTWGVEVNGTSVEVPTQETKLYSLYHPSAVDIDNNPENPTFGLILANEAMHEVKGKSGYLSSGYGAGIYAFTPSFDPILNGEDAGFNGGITFVNTNSTGTSYAPRRVRISDDGRIFVTSLDVNGTYLWELNPENLNEWTPVFTDTQMNELAEVYDADSNFVVGPNAGFDVRGTGENLQILMLSGNTKAFGFAPNGFKCAEYNLGTAKTWTGAPTRIIWDSIYALVPTQVQVQYDAEGGVWLGQYRGTCTEDQPGLVHWTAEGVEDYKELRHMTRNAGIRFNNDFTKLVVAGNNGAAKKATIYAVSKDENGAPVLTEETVIDMAAVGNNLNDFAFDYAGNLYACGNSAEKLIGWAMPYSGQVVTPAASQYAFTVGTAVEPVEMVGVVKRALQYYDATIVLTHEADGTAHIYNVIDGVVAEVSQEGVLPVDTENPGSYLAISDIAVTEDGKLVANNYNRCSFNDGAVESGYKRGTLTFYIWNDLAAAPAIWFQSKASSNSNNSDQGYTMALTGTSTNANILVSGVHNTQRGVRMSHFSVVDGVFEDTQDGAANLPYYYYIGSNFKGASAGADAAVFNEQTHGANIQFHASPLADENWIIDGELTNPIEFTNPQTHGGEVVVKAALTEDLGKKYNGASYVAVGEQVLMVAPYATAEGLLAGVKVLDITAGLDAATEVAVADLDAAVEATAAATAVAVNNNVLTITLVADATLHTLVVELAPATSGTTLTATGLETKLESDGSYTLQGQAVVNGDESNLMDFMLCVYPTEGYTDAFLNNWSVMIFGAPTPGAFVDNGDGTFTYTAKIEDTYGDGTVYNISMSGTIKTSDGPEYMELDDQITNLTFDLENMIMTGGPSTNYVIEVVLGLGEDNFDGTFTLSSESTVSVRGMAAEFIEGYAYNIDPYAPSAVAVVKVNWDGMYYAFTLNMSAGVADATVIEINDATVTIDTVPLFDDVVDYALKMTANWTNPEDGVTYPVLVEVPVYYPEAAEPYEIMSTVTVGDLVDENGPWLGFGEGTLTVTTEGGVVTVTGLVENSWAGFAANVTISGQLPQGPTTGIDNVQVELNAVKTIKNGMLIINRDGVEYNVQGAVVK